jgi:hypothetical protein
MNTLYPSLYDNVLLQFSVYPEVRIFFHFSSVYLMIKYLNAKGRRPAFIYRPAPGIRLEFDLGDRLDVWQF